MSATFRVGERVQVPLGRRTVPGIITEVRGAIGVRGRRLYQVRVSMDPFEPATYELPEDEIRPLDPSSDNGSALCKEKVIAYLVNGGLIAILRAPSGGSRGQQLVWLRPDTVGNVTHTFDEEWGVVGGAAVPFLAVHDDKVFTPKRADVLALLQSFQLERSEAERIVAEVGTAP